jgi:hypothetical protein
VAIYFIYASKKGYISYSRKKKKSSTKAQKKSIFHAFLDKYINLSSGYFIFLPQLEIK